jgi:hypothetical protein
MAHGSDFRSELATQCRKFTACDQVRIHRKGLSNRLL